ncbi:MAG: oxidoreductase [Vicinamibacteria bacterium]|jgi:NAD-reducing hydrogenase small subunit|nr:oxidoreductase [Vicinamibacteria bacterium]
MSAKARVATAWLGGCSGCHMSFLDLDERLIDLAPHIELVFSPIVDTKEFPENVDVTLVEGAVANVDNLALIRQIRERTKILIAFGDCAVAGNVTAMRNLMKSERSVLERSYIENVTLQPQLPEPSHIVPALLPRVRAIHEVVKVDLFLPGCPPSADLIHYAVAELLAGRTPVLTDRLIYG